MHLHIIMRHNIILTLLLAVAAMLTMTSCSTKQTITVQGTPGTIISSPKQQQIAVIGNDGQAAIQLKRSAGYLPFLLAQSPNSRLQVPFALDYNNSNIGALQRVGVVAGGTAAVIGLAVAIAGAASAEESTSYRDDDSYDLAMTGIYVMLTGTAVTLACLPGVTGDSGNFKYVSRQQTNQDLIK